jgi:hypothetical protein
MGGAIDFFCSGDVDILFLIVEICIDGEKKKKSKRKA